MLRARAEITSHFAAGPQARWRGASDELYPGRYVRSEQQSQRACGPQPEGARRRAGICFVAAPQRCPTSPSSRRLASAPRRSRQNAEFISERTLKPARAQCSLKAELQTWHKRVDEWIRNTTCGALGMVIYCRSSDPPHNQELAKLRAVSLHLSLRS